MKRLFVLSILIVFMALLNCPAGFAEEMFILSTRDGSEIIVKDFKFTDEYIEFTTGNGLPGFIKKEDLVKISNMVGIPPQMESDARSVEQIKQRELQIWLVSAAVLIALYLVYLLYVIRKKKGRTSDTVAIFPGRVEKKSKTQGHLAFQYKERSGRRTNWVIEVSSAYEENGVLFIEGICTSTDKRKTFRADRMAGPVKDMSSGRQCQVEAIFTTAGKT